MEFRIMVDILLIFLLVLVFYSQVTFQKLNLLTSWIFLLIEKYILGKKMPNQ